VYPFLNYLEAAIAAAIVLLLGAILTRTATSRLLLRGATPQSVRTVRGTVTTIAAIIAAAAVFILIGPISLVSGLTFSAIVGLAITLALQTTLGNIIAGFILLQDRTIRMDDTITIGSVTGRVVRIGLVTVWVRIDDGSLATMSNSTLLAGPMINRSARDRLKGEY
jgi:small-conductance mechanosensitive channel